MNAVTKDIVENHSCWTLNETPVLNDDEFCLWQNLMEQRTGISLSVDRKSFLTSNLLIRMHELGLTQLDDYYKLFVSNSNAGIIEWEVLVDRLTVHETRFFRDKGALELVGKNYLTSKTGIIGNQNSIQIWSVGCATGEEPYSIAIVLDYFMRINNIDGYLGVFASDISGTAIAKGYMGVYHRNRLSNLPIEYLKEYFIPIDLDHYKIVDSIRNRICFSKLNLMNMNNACIADMDIIYCQNVLIYFKREKRIKILDQLVSRLKPGGLLVLGPGEITSWQNSLVKQVSENNVLAFRRLEENKYNG
ncbi:Chemotaxis protein methyltransferase CheR [hydrothermal vent metagenome]|uniref:protein-glutamate O-methyltransferase n=1 Tax=hydrothermal vent metagenome TaxID=652676 RepID=A0A3B1AHZ0_9ZZZZ